MFCYFTSLRLGLFWIFVCFYCNPLGERCRWQYLAMAIFCFAYFGWRFFHNESLPGYHLWVSTHMSSIYHAQYSDGQKFLFALTTGCPKLYWRYSGIKSSQKNKIKPVPILKTSPFFKPGPCPRLSKIGKGGNRFFCDC